MANCFVVAVLREVSTGTGEDTDTGKGVVDAAVTGIVRRVAVLTVRADNDA